MSQNMLDIMKSRMPEGLEIKSIRENASNYRITFVYDGETEKSDLPKACAPGCHNQVADHTIITAMSSFMIRRGDLKAAREWLDKLLDE